MSMKFEEWTGNRLCKSFKDDCVIRSISIVSGLRYELVFWDLMNLGLEIGAYPNHPKVWERYVEQDLLWLRTKPPRDANGKYIKLGDWDFKGSAIIKSRSHLTAAVTGTVIDTWDCRYRPVNTYWINVEG